MEYNVGDIVAYMYLPGVELTIIGISHIPPTYTSYKLSSGDTVFDSHITLIKAYQPEDRNHTTLIIAACIVGYLIMKG